MVTENREQSQAGRLRRLFAFVTSPAGIYLVSSVLAKAGVNVLVPLYTRRLTIEEFGEYGLAQTLAQVGPMFLSLGTLAAVSTFYFSGKDLEKSRRKSGSAARVSIVLTTTLGLLVQVAVLLFAPRGVGLGSTRALSCVLWGGIGAFFAQIPVVYFRAQQRPLRAAAFQLFQFLAVVGAAYVQVVVFGRGLLGAIEAIALSGVTMGVLGVAFALLALPGTLNRAIARETLHFSLPFVPHFASMQITSISDRWIMKGSGRELDLGSYSLAVTVTGPIGMVLSAWNESESPKMGETVRRGGRRAVAAGFPKILLQYALATLVPGLALLAALPLLKIIVGQRFSHALWPIPIMIGLIVLESPFSPCINVFSYFKRTRVIPLITMSGALLHLLANLLLIPRWGTAGALVARAIACLARSSVLIWFAVQTLRQPDVPEDADA